MNTYLEKYYEAIQRKRIVVPDELKSTIENLIKDLHNEKYVYDTRNAHLIIEQYEKFLKFIDPFTGQPIKLMLWQKAFIEVYYSFKIRKTGKQRFENINVKEK